MSNYAKYKSIGEKNESDIQTKYYETSRPKNSNNPYIQYKDLEVEKPSFEIKPSEKPDISNNNSNSMMKSYNKK